ncbi:MAG: branched-chain amino acid ABC transporter permease [Cyanobacteriota bacterium]|nr:branched-chain amino acid ABC transporter permease [Cyanobacteriota bacterium]
MLHLSAPAKAGLLLGLIAALTILLFGGWSSVVIGAILGAAAAHVACYWTPDLGSPRRGAQVGQLAGLTLGLVGVVATVIEAQVLLPAAGEEALSWLQTVVFAGCTLIGAYLTGLGMGSLQGLPEHRQRNNKWVLAGFAVLYPLIDYWAGLGWTATVIQILIFAMLALGLNIVVGYAGLLDLGYAAFFAIGAYTTAFFSSPQLGLQWNFWIVIWIAAAVAALAGVTLGSPTLPLRGDYLAIVTLGFGEIVPIVFRNLTSIRLNEPISAFLGGLFNRPEWVICWVGCEEPFNLTGGEAGINPIGRPSLPLIGSFTSSNYLPWYFLILSLVVMALFAIGRLRQSRIGRAWAAMREDELAASTMGINLVQTKLMAFAMGATFSGFAGAFYASYIRAIFPTVFDFSVSVIILCMVILGGLGNMTGVLLGCFIIMGADRLYLPQLAQVLKKVLQTSILPNIPSPAWQEFISTSIDPIQMRLFLFGLTLVIMMLVRPEGLIPSATRRAELHHGDPNGEVPATEETAISSSGSGSH